MATLLILSAVKEVFDQGTYISSEFMSRTVEHPRFWFRLQSLKLQVACNFTGPGWFKRASCSIESALSRKQYVGQSETFMPEGSDGILTVPRFLMLSYFRVLAAAFSGAVPRSSALAVRGQSP